MTAILDTSFLFAIVNSKDKNHLRVVDISLNLKEQLILPVKHCSYFEILP